MTIRSQEQDDADKQGISLYASKGKDSNKANENQ